MKNMVSATPRRNPCYPSILGRLIGESLLTFCGRLTAKEHKLPVMSENYSPMWLWEKFSMKKPETLHLNTR